jgi:iron complex transport system ATP-binding protein
MNRGQPLLQTMDLQAGYRSGSHKTVTIAGPLGLDIYPGELICLLGPNGSGKSTLLRTLAGLQPPLAGSIEITGAGMDGLTPAQLAKKVSLVLTDRTVAGDLTVYSLVALGRYPYSGWLGILNDEDRTAIDRAIDATGVASLIHRKAHTLSDGERQKVMLARALAQDTPLLMLDEPTAHLDLPSRIQLMQLLHRLARQTGKGVLLSTHELDLALQVASKVWLLQSGGTLHQGTPEDLVLNGAFENAFVKEGIVFDRETGNFNMHHDHSIPVRLSGEGAAAFWTGRALQRQGFAVITNDPSAFHPDDKAIRPFVVCLPAAGGHTTWKLEMRDATQTPAGGAGTPQMYDTIAGLLKALQIAVK